MMSSVDMENYATKCKCQHKGPSADTSISWHNFRISALDVMLYLYNVGCPWRPKPNGVSREASVDSNRPHEPCDSAFNSLIPFLCLQPHHRP